MFDRLIESDTIGADFKPRRRYFIISSVVVGLLFASAVVISLYATDIGLGDDSYELSAIVAPVQPPAEVPEQPRPDRQRDVASAQTNERTIRIIRQAPIEDEPKTVPPISYNPNRFSSLTKGPVEIGTVDKTGATVGEGPIGTTSSSTEPSSTQTTEIVDERPPNVDLPPPVTPRPKPVPSIGVVNGKATYLPIPPYPAAAVVMRIEGKVDVQVTIDETGEVISANAASGNALLRQAAENAAWKAKFTPTLLSKVPVKVTGVIVYNFTRN
ncbi:MAG TPA: energy transducer TonB [Pyrinomonadaceae bacterium]